MPRPLSSWGAVTLAHTKKLKPYIPLRNIYPNYCCVYVSFSGETVVIKLGKGKGILSITWQNTEEFIRHFEKEKFLHCELSLSGETPDHSHCPGESRAKGTPRLAVHLQMRPTRVQPSSAPSYTSWSTVKIQLVFIKQTATSICPSVYLLNKQVLDLDYAQGALTSTEEEI